MGDPLGYAVLESHDAGRHGWCNEDGCNREPDIRVRDHGSVVLIVPESFTGRRWIEDHVDREGPQPKWPSVLAEPRLVVDVLQGMEDDGLVVTT